MRNEPRGVSVFTALAVIAIIIIGGIVSVRSSETYSTESTTPNEQQVAAPVQALPITPERTDNTPEVEQPASTTTAISSSAELMVELE